MQVIPLENDKSKDNVIFESREVITDIQKYLDDSLAQLQSLDYYIEDFFEACELFNILNEDLPTNSFNRGREQFINDMVNFCEQFFNRTKSKNIRFQLEIVRTDMCRLFHVDNMKQRLLCTYMGPGTEWLDHSNVYRDGLGKGCNTKIVKDFKRINKAKPFEVIILKGIKDKGKKLAVVHRSPPVEKEFKTRVLLKIDECEKG